MPHHRRSELVAEFRDVLHAESQVSGMAPGAGMPFAGPRRVRFEGAVAPQADQYEGESTMKYLAVSTNSKDVSPFIAAEIPACRGAQGGRHDYRRLGEGRFFRRGSRA